MSLKFLSTKIRKEIMRRQAMQVPSGAEVIIRHYDDKVLKPNPRTLYI